MPAVKISQQPLPARRVEYLSPPSEVRMADPWFDITGIDHFWIRRRFEVFQTLAGALPRSDDELAEIGCGHGLLQRQMEEAYGREVTGFDLNEYALKLNVSRKSKVCCYNVYQQDPRFRAAFGLILLFDVLEHIQEEHLFLQSVLFHLAPGGKLVVNVPAGQWAYSAYDVAAGHVRRYSIKDLQAVASRVNLRITRWTYWGLPLLPSLALRKLWLSGATDQSKIISTGFDSRGKSLNRLLHWLSHCEMVPQKFAGTSLMAVLTPGI